jgi:hypothetical protein
MGCPHGFMAVPSVTACRDHRIFHKPEGTESVESITLHRGRTIVYSCAIVKQLT